MEFKATTQSAKVLADLLSLSVSEQYWVQKQYLQSASSETQKELKAVLDIEVSTANSRANLFEEAREKLLEDINLSAGEKVLLAALMLNELYEIEEFHSRQITETLRDTSNPVNNVTAALNGLISRKDVEISDPTRAARNTHKRYKLTSNGFAAAAVIARKKPSARDISAAR